MKGIQIAICGGVMLALAACAPVRLIADHDEVLERQVGSLQAGIDGFLLTLADTQTFPDCGLDGHKPFYRDTKIALASLQTRADAWPDNALTSQQVTLLGSSFGSLEQLHRLKSARSACLLPAEIEPLLRGFDSSFTAILKLEFAKRRGALTP